MAIFGSAYPVGKLILNTSLPPMLMASIRMGIVFLCLIPFWRFEIPKKKYFLPLLGFSLSMGAGVFTFMNLALQKASIVSPIIIGAQLAVPFAIIISSIFINEKISFFEDGNKSDFINSLKVSKDSKTLSDKEKFLTSLENRAEKLIELIF